MTTDRGDTGPGGPTDATGPGGPPNPLGPDLIAGLSIAGLLLPEAIAYAGIAGLPPQAGVWSLFAGLLVYGWIGRGRTAVVAATSSSAAVLAAATLSLGGTDPALRVTLAAGLVLLTGLFFVLAGLAKLGEASSVIARPVLRGFAFGLALTIIVKQWTKLSGVPHGASRVVDEALHQLARIGDWNPWTLAVGATALVLLRLLARWPAIPGALVVVGAGIAAQRWAPASGGGLAAHGVAAVGPIDFALAVPGLPVLSRETWLRLGELAFAMVFILYAESYSAIRAGALRRREDFFPNRELVALGACNLAAGLLQGLPVGAGFSATAANETAGARTRTAAWVAALAVGAVVATLLPWVASTPEPVLAAIVIHAVSHTLRLEVFRPYFAWQRDRIVSVAAVVAVLWFGVLDGLLAAVGVSLLLYLRELSTPRLSELGRLGGSHDFVPLAGHPQAQPVPGLLILRPEAPLFFGNVDRIAGALLERLHGATPLPWARVILSLEESADLDSSCLETLGELALQIAALGPQLQLARLKDDAHAALARAALPALPPACLSTLSVDDTVAAAVATLQAGH